MHDSGRKLNKLEWSANFFHISAVDIRIGRYCVRNDCQGTSKYSSVTLAPKAMTTVCHYIAWMDLLELLLAYCLDST